MRLLLHIKARHYSHASVTWAYVHFGAKGAIIFFRIGGHEKAGGSQNFFMRNRGVTKKTRDYWVATNFMNILFNEIAPKMLIFRATRIGGLQFLQYCNSGGGGHEIFDHQIGGVTKILPRYFWKFMTPTIPKKMVAP